MNKYNQYVGPIDFFRMCHGDTYSKDTIKNISSKTDAEFGEEFSFSNKTEETDGKITPRKQNFKHYCFLNQRIK